MRYCLLPEEVEGGYLGVFLVFFFFPYLGVVGAVWCGCGWVGYQELERWGV